MLTDSDPLQTDTIAVLHCFIIIRVCCSAECMTLWVCVNNCIECLFVSKELISAGRFVSCFASISSNSIVHLYLSLCLGMMVFGLSCMNCWLESFPFPPSKPLFVCCLLDTGSGSISIQSHSLRWIYISLPAHWSNSKNSLLNCVETLDGAHQFSPSFPI